MVVTVAFALTASAAKQRSVNSNQPNFYGWVFANSQSDEVQAGQHFRQDVFGKEPLYVSREFNRDYFESTLSVDKIWPQLSANVSDASSLAEKGNAIDIRVGGTKATATPEMRAVISNPVDSHKSIPTKHSFIIRFEELEDRGEALDELRRRMSSESVGSEMGSVHGYYSGPGGTKALMPHTDPYDVVVLQIAGSKQWTTCVPSTPSNVTSAMRAKAYAKEHTNGKSCVTHDTASLKRMVCNHFVMRAGDALYLPRDIVHYAETTDEASVHLTIGLGGDDAECDTQDAMDSFTADVVQRSRRTCTTSCDDSCDSGVSSCDSGCDVCDGSCDAGCPDISPTQSPTVLPTKIPSPRPTDSPTTSPSVSPTISSPTSSPTTSPTTSSPTQSPSAEGVSLAAFIAENGIGSEGIGLFVGLAAFVVILIVGAYLLGKRSKSVNGHDDSSTFDNPSFGFSGEAKSTADVEGTYEESP